MITRRDFIAMSAVAAAAPLAARGCASADGEIGYDEAVRKTWRHTEGGPTDGAALARELVRYATLAPSSHNTPRSLRRPVDDVLVSSPV